MQITFRAVRELEPGPVWQSLFEASWGAYQSWFLSEGDARRPGYLSCRTALKRYMPELVPTWERLVELAGGGDMEARFLSLYRPTPFLSGCTQAVWRRGQRCLLIRNYDYHPGRIEGTILLSAWNGVRTIVQSDCLWGALDGMNERGLAVSLAFGGRQAVGDGFGIPLILRYVMEPAGGCAEARDILSRVPSYMF
jgi:predicted choloylglycine hydrolase